MANSTETHLTIQPKQRLRKSLLEVTLLKGLSTTEVCAKCGLQVPNRDRLV